jgi:hydroxypyruvate reductase
MDIRKDADHIIEYAIKEVLPHDAVKRALEGARFGSGRIVLVAVGKAAWSMAKAANDQLSGRIFEGIVITKYEHSQGNLPQIEVFEAGHPIPDDNSFKATERALKLTENLCENDTVLFLLSGGGSALFEKPLISGDALQDITKQMLACGADIVEINTIRKRLSAVKGGRFALHCSPAKVFSIVLSDIIGDPLDMIASGPAYPDSSTSEDALKIAKKYSLSLCPEVESFLKFETPKTLSNVETHVTGSVKELCRAAERACLSLGYRPIILTNCLSCEAREAGKFLASIAKFYSEATESLAFIVGGETVVHLKGNGKGGRNQELALAAAEGLKGLSNTAIFSFGSDGTDGPTDAAGGFVDHMTLNNLISIGVDVNTVLENNDAYNALKKCDGLIITGATGTNVNDAAVLLIKR